MVKSPEKASKFEKLKASLILQKKIRTPLQTRHLHSTLKRRVNDRFHFVLTWNIHGLQTHHVYFMLKRGKPVVCL